MRVYFTLFNICAWNFGAFYSTKYGRWYIQLIPVVLCMVVVPRGRPACDYADHIGTGEFGDG
jgi:hypothetical protein